MYPTWRPDAALTFDDPRAWNVWVGRLEAAANRTIRTFNDLVQALDTRHRVFHELGCRASDHGLETLPPPSAYADAAGRVDVRRPARGHSVDRGAALALQAALLHRMALMDHERGWVQQFHLGAYRNVSTRLFGKLGPNVGGDSMGDFEMARGLAAFLDGLDKRESLAKTILYNLNPRDNELFATMVGNFNDGTIPGKMQYGASWWFLDQKDGIEAQFQALSNMGLLSRFVGMITDSRSFLSYSRHDYFRRILCNLLGEDVRLGLVPDDRDALGKLVSAVCFTNATRLLRIPLGHRGRLVPEPLRIAILGAGMVARYHAQAIAATPGARLVAVSRSDASKAAASAAEFGVPCETSDEALLARPDVDAVCICTPSGQHARETIAAARAGKHVLVEKPMALSLADADAMIEACRSAGVTLAWLSSAVPSPPTSSCTRRSRTAFSAGPFSGMAVIPYFRSKAYYDSAVWRGTWKEDGGGALMNQGIHIADLLAWFMGDVEEVFARAATLAHEIEVEDDVVATVRFKSGALGSIVATTAAAPGFPHRVEVYGSRGGVQLEAEAIVRWEGESVPTIDPSLRAGSAPAAAGAGSSPTGIAPTGHARILADFVASIREGRAPLVPGRGRRSLALVLAIYEAARSGRAVRLTDRIVALRPCRRERLHGRPALAPR